MPAWRRFRPRLNTASLTVGVVLPVALLFVSGTPILDLIELKTYDLRFLSRGPRQPSSAVVMAAIDEKSLDTEGRWPWPRSKIAALVDALSRDGARVIAFDIAFSEPDENSQITLMDQLAQRVESLAIKDWRLSDFISERRRHADNDLALATAIKSSSAAVVLGYFFHMSEAALEYRLEPDEIARRLKRLAASKYPLVAYATADTGAVPFVRAYAPESNLELFSEAAASSAYFSLRSDPDGILRWMPLVIQGGEDLFPPLAVACAWHYLGKPRLTVKVGRHGVEGIQLGDRLIPTDESGQLLINYYGPPKTFAQVSVTDILRGKVAAGTFKDRIVLVGATALGTYDLRSTPFSPLYPGMEVHASVIENVLTGSFMARPEWSKVFDLLAIVALGGLVGAALPRLSPLRGLGFAAGLFALYVLGARWLFVYAQVWLNMVYPLLALLATYTALTAYAYVTEQRQRKRVKETFRQYVAPLVVEEMLKDPGRLRLGGEEKVLTVLFSDLEGFTAHAERYAPHETAQMLGEYYNRVTEQVFIHQGTLKEYVADELMAIFGAPLPQADHAVRACATALAMREQRLVLAAEWATLGRPRLRARTGVNTGPMLVGNLGSKYRFAYGVLGDQVNLGSRLEALNKAYGTEILIGENTARLVGDAFRLREIDTVRVVGRAQTVRVYELLAPVGPLAPEQEKALKSYAAGLEAYRQQVWDDALALFREALTLWPADGAARTMASRCELYQKTAPPEAWDGVFEQEFKK
ncbi:MAG TPA: adenylate/guanylate cyclase domain-containing protein [Methylomirabilota bacterium]|nr:adenylate/guanylate cyclase domain-containing protein [Methylomirabilota bacterium]